MDATDWNRRYAERELPWSADPNRFVVAELSGVAPGSALDLAAGEGRNAIWLAERGRRVHAVDFSRVAIDRGREIAGRRGVEIDWQVADIKTWAPKTGAYDLVLVAYLHLPRPEMRNALHKAAEAVAPGGLFLLIGHDRENLDAGHGGPQDPDVLYTPGDVVRELAGFEVDKAERVRRPSPPMTERSRRSITSCAPSAAAGCEWRACRGCLGRHATRTRSPVASGHHRCMQ